MIPGPCVICGGTNYELSCGGPTICPKCDCGHFDAATVLAQAKAMESLRAEIERLKAALSWLEDLEPGIVEDAREKFLI